MRLIGNNILYIYYLIALFFILLIMNGCSDQESNGCTRDEYAHIALSVRTSASSINDDKQFWEDRVDELRMIVFDTNGGSVVFHKKIGIRRKEKQSST